MSSTSKTTNGGIGFTGVLAILFIGLKLTGVIQWSWLWVLSPLWLPWVVVLVVAFFIFLTALIIEVLKK